MQEQLGNLITEVRSALRFRWYGMLAAWIVALAGWFWVASMPDVYEASTRIYVNTTSVLERLLGDRIAVYEVDNQIDYVRQAMLGREQLEAVLTEMDVDLDALTPESRERVITRLRDSVVIEAVDAGSGGTGQENTFLIYYESTSRDSALGVVESLLDTFVNYTLSESLRNDAEVEDFIEESIAELRVRRDVAQRALTEFRSQNADRLPSTQGDFYERLGAAQGELRESRRELRNLEAKRGQLRLQLDAETQLQASGDALGDTLPEDSLDARIRNTERELDLALLRFTDRHPDVIALRETLEFLKAERAVRLAELGITGTDIELYSLYPNPIYQALQIELNDTEIEIATTRADIADREEEVARLENSIEELPLVEAELKRYQDEYEFVSNQLLELELSRETQNLTSRASAADPSDFRVIDPPFSASYPSGPPRQIMHIMVLLGAMFVGGAFCYLCAQIWPVFGRAKALRDTVGLPVLGTVATAWQEKYAAKMRRATLGYAFATAALIVVFGFLVWVDVSGLGLESFMSSTS